MGELVNSSIIVRTQDRPTLPRTLARIARQARPPAEIVLVDAVGTLAAMRTPFAFTRRPTAIYHASAGIARAGSSSARSSCASGRRRAPRW